MYIEPSSPGDQVGHILLSVSAGEAKNIPPYPGPNKMRDCYCTVNLDQEEVFRTKTIEKSLCPFYGEDFYCEIPRSFRHLSFYIFDRDVFRRDSSIGKVAVKKEDLQKYHGKDHWFPLQPVCADSEVQGKVHLELRLSEVITDSGVICHKLATRVLECQDLPIVNGQCDPYAAVSLLGPSRSEAKKTKVKRKTNNPQFDEVFFFEVGAHCPRMWPVYLRNTCLSENQCYSQLFSFKNVRSRPGCLLLFRFVKPSHCQFTQLYFGTLGCQLAENSAFHQVCSFLFLSSIWQPVCAKSEEEGPDGKKPSPIFRIWTAIPSLTTRCQSYIQFMIKRAQGRNRFGLKNFKKRWFRLTNHKFTYHKTKGEGALCSIPIENILAVERLEEESFKMKNMFQVIQPERVLYIQANNCVEARDWIDILTKVSQCNRKRLSTYHPSAYLNGHWLCCKLSADTAPGCTPCTGGLPANIQLDVDGDRETERIYSLYSTYMSKLVKMQEACGSKSVYDGPEQEEYSTFVIDDPQETYKTLRLVISAVQTLEQQHMQYKRDKFRKTKYGSQEHPIGDQSFQCYIRQQSESSTYSI
uniref:RAS p21 protein activator 3 n=1 Tax=Cyprinus carpio TaxID=7962 RepID=A0A8C1NIL8_CYPCA